MCSYEPVHSVQQLESFVPCPDAVVHPDYPQWQSLTLEGGHQIAHKGQRQDVVEEAGIHAEVSAFAYSSTFADTCADDSAFSLASHIAARRIPRNRSASDNAIPLPLPLFSAVSVPVDDVCIT
jgi:hypothetical protein